VGVGADPLGAFMVVGEGGSSCEKIAFDGREKRISATL